MRARATVQADQPTLETAKINLGCTKIRASIAGVIGPFSVTVGEVVTDAQPNALATIRQLNSIYIKIQQTDTEFLAVKQVVRQGKLKPEGDNNVPITFSPVSNADITLSGNLRDVARDRKKPGSPFAARHVCQRNHGAGVMAKVLLVPQQVVT